MSQARLHRITALTLLAVACVATALLLIYPPSSSTAGPGKCVHKVVFGKGFDRVWDGGGDDLTMVADRVAFDYDRVSSWSPSGGKIAYAKKDPDRVERNGNDTVIERGEAHIHTIKPDGGRIVLESTENPYGGFLSSPGFSLYTVEAPHFKNVRHVERVERTCIGDIVSKEYIESRIPIHEDPPLPPVGPQPGPKEKPGLATKAKQKLSTQTTPTKAEGRSGPKDVPMQGNRWGKILPSEGSF